ncbi:putative Flp pilus-assembly TadE/G-like protein [Thermodesulfitimonas autotrophica]|uniref:Putative Flp pilus-assembly TadE/G-like protein n=1 Tax=Thermodesulfitimonas autotrophica TaxID=1894989 RepID=A0A3N5AX28_9THEO|nr:pilus assembly protein TadG-related protein [Thermodesulfitimonas autotrophica]RPF49579.1 putative Flp pilus-assembly TadE/G-like protein [Thermodesulfitimonas autotrophica]
MLHDERGMVPTTISLLMIPLAMLAMLMFFDLARIHLVRGQLRTAADAGALAAAQTAVLEPRYVYEAVYDSQGNLIALNAKIAGYDAVIKDPVLAETAARDAVRRNISGILKAQEKAGLLEFDVSPVPANDSFAGRIEGDTNNKYRVSLSSRLKLLLAGPLAKLWGLNDADKGVGATGTGEAVAPAAP